ncbi:30S ribosomal protein S13 [Capsulimonas corticalis]|uniref:Small ribosomal subunit protein uS13 n=1 Tax=Capsulimonas corticalis TaxID=2219043 RepID=A0A402CYK3_9BACT|nr:30S ribosomal protein S13 [Capsulimonas corticalis]BDI31334.1 30S ribosomal protein S13 [Capsulimonas corticalis]
MARIAGVDLPRDKRVEYALLSIFGIGLTSSRDILTKNDISLDTRVRDLTETEVSKLRETIEREFRVEGDLKRQIAINIRRLQEIGCYRGIRHRKGLPVRGQKTKSNARTRRGPRRAVAGKKKIKK